MAATYGACCVAGDRLQACDAAGDWGDATVLDKQQCIMRASPRWTLLVTFDGWSDRYNEWIPVGTGRLRPSCDSRSQLGCAVAGWKVRVKWDERTWCMGTVTMFNEVTQKHLVGFDDGDADWCANPHCASRVARSLAHALSARAGTTSSTSTPPACSSGSSRRTTASGAGGAPARRHLRRSSLNLR